MDAIERRRNLNSIIRKIEFIGRFIVFSVKLASARKKLDFGSILQEINAVVAIFYDTWFVRRIERDRGGLFELGLYESIWLRVMIYYQVHGTGQRRTSGFG